MPRSVKRRCVKRKRDIKRRRSGNVQNTRTKTRTKTRKRRKIRNKLQKGGSISSKLSSVLNAIPGGTDFRDFYWSSTNSLGNLWKNWNGFPGAMSSSVLDQPINMTNDKPSFNNNIDISKIYNNAGLTASDAKYQAFN